MRVFKFNRQTLRLMSLFGRYDLRSEVTVIPGQQHQAILSLPAHMGSPGLDKDVGGVLPLA